jgi:hypothetical protein
MIIWKREKDFLFLISSVSKVEETRKDMCNMFVMEEINTVTTN